MTKKAEYRANLEGNLLIASALGIGWARGAKEVPKTSVSAVDMLQMVEGYHGLPSRRQNLGACVQGTEHQIPPHCLVMGWPTV